MPEVTWLGGTWLDAVRRLRERREPGVLVTVVEVRGHAPREAGAKMVVGVDETAGSIGGGNVEAVAIEAAREMLTALGRAETVGAQGNDAHSSAPQSVVPQLIKPKLIESRLSDRAPYEHGVQCCGGTMTVLLEPLPVVPAVAIFGVGHVGIELARILTRHDIELHLIDSRPAQLADDRLAVLADAVARVHVHRVPLLPEISLGELPRGTHVLIMTHDHAEDYALCDAVLRHGEHASIGLIGSAAKWARFRSRLRIDGGFDDTTIDRIRTPIGLPDLVGKQPATIAVSVAADLLRAFERERERCERQPEHPAPIARSETS